MVLPARTHHLFNKARIHRPQTVSVEEQRRWPSETAHEELSPWGEVEKVRVGGGRRDQYCYVYVPALYAPVCPAYALAGLDVARMHSP